MADKLIISYVNFNLTMRHWLSITFKASFKARWTNPIFSCRKLYPITPHNISVYHKPDLMVHRASEKKQKKPKQNKKKEKNNFSKFNEYTCYTSKYFILFFLSLRAGGILQILQSDLFWEWAVFYDLARFCLDSFLLFRKGCCQRLHVAFNLE